MPELLRTTETMPVDGDNGLLNSRTLCFNARLSTPKPPRFSYRSAVSLRGQCIFRDPDRDARVRLGCRRDERKCTSFLPLSDPELASSLDVLGVQGLQEPATCVRRDSPVG